MEPLVESLQSHPKVLEFKIKDTEHKIDLYTDESILSLTDLLVSLQKVQQLVIEFGQISL